MTIHVNIGEAKDRLSQLLSAALAGEEVILQRAGVPKAKLVPLPEAAQLQQELEAMRRSAAFGMFRDAYDKDRMTALLKPLSSDELGI